MFKEKPKIKRSSWHYKVWYWTWENIIWDKCVPEVRSICAYCHRVLWYGLLLLPILHFFYGIFWPFKKIGRTSFMAALLFWVFFTGSMFLIKAEMFLIVFICLITLTCLVFCILVLIIIGLMKLGELGVFKPVAIVTNYDWQFYRRYCVPKYRLPVEEFDYNHRRNPLWLHLLFWIQPVGFMALVFFGGQTVLPEKMIDGGTIPLIWTIIALIISYLVVTPIVMWRRAVLERRKLYWEHPELEPVKERSKLGIQIEDTWELFLNWLEAKKERVCPLVDFVD